MDTDSSRGFGQIYNSSVSDQACASKLSIGTSVLAEVAGPRCACPTWSQFRIPMLIFIAFVFEAARTFLNPPGVNRNESVHRFVDTLCSGADIDYCIASGNH